MKSGLKNKLREILHESMQFNRADLLVDLQKDSPLLIQPNESLRYQLDAFSKGLLKEALHNKSESGINSLCLAEALVSWNYKGLEIHSPVFLTPLSFTLHKNRGEIHLESIVEERFINPFLRLNFPELDAITEEMVENFFASEDLTFDTNFTRIGSFHHHRFDVIRELELLSKRDTHSPALRGAFGFDRDSYQVKLPSQLLFPADTDHRLALDLVSHSDIVIQGPPGTGKSQVLANLAAQAIHAQLATLFVSEKRAALEIIPKKLAVFGLDRLCFIAGGERLSTTFIHELKNTYLYFESFEKKHSQQYYTGESEAQSIQFTLDLLHQPGLIGGLSLDTFLEAYPNRNEEPVVLEKAPDLIDFRENEDLIRTLYESGVVRIICRIRPEIFRKGSTYLEQQIRETLDLIKVLQPVQLDTWKSFESNIKIALRCQVFENDIYRKYATIFQPGSKEQKSFLKYQSRLKSLTTKLSAFQLPELSGMLQFSKEAVTELKERLQPETGFYARMKARRLWQKVSPLPLDLALPLIEQVLKWHDLKEKQEECIKHLQELGIEDPLLESSILLHSLQQYSSEEWKELMFLPFELKRAYTNSHEKLSRLYQALQKNFLLDLDDNPEEFLNEVLSGLGKLELQRDKISKLSDQLLLSLRISDQFSGYKSLIIAHHRTLFEARFPRMAGFKVSELGERIEQCVRLQDADSICYAEEILEQIKSRFDSFHQLLRTPAVKLSSDNKVLKQRLRNGKAILVREFAKSRRHRTLHELFHSDALLWIQLLKPIWLSNPVQLARTFPPETALFDLVVFDESSQIPLAHALGAIERGKRIVVAGDEHQMGPQRYFQTGSSETLSLLQQVMFYWTPVSLTHHYRSIHSDLISFSNTHFYQNSLKSFPAPNTGQVLFLHHVNDGVYHERGNQQEAEALVKILRPLLRATETFGVVAFSEEQLRTIYQCLNPEEQDLLEQRIAGYQCFFKAVENVQGDECDHLLISFGFGRNNEGIFQMRFGPMSTTNGSKRLNVLLTRAIRSLHFFTSVEAKDFRITSNETVGLIRQWFLHLEGHKENKCAEFPFDLQPEINGSVLTLKGVHRQLKNSHELLTLHRVLKQRGWKLHYS